MKYRFEITATDKDFYDFNIFMITKSPYIRKTVLSIRIIVAFIALFIIGRVLYTEDFTPSTFISIIPALVVLVLLELSVIPFLKLSMKGTIKGLKKDGKLPYSSSSVIEFYDDRFIEITPENKTEQLYSSIENISVEEGKKIYIHVNRVMSYLIPLKVFESETQYNEFLEFTKTKNEDIKFYKK